MLHECAVTLHFVSYKDHFAGVYMASVKLYELAYLLSIAGCLHLSFDLLL